MRQKYWSPSTQEHNITAIKISEESLLNQFTTAILKGMPGTNYRNKPEMTLTQVSRDSNRKLKKGDWHIALHTNAGGGSGMEAFANLMDVQAVEFAERTLEQLARITKLPNRGVKDGRHLFEVNPKNHIKGKHVVLFEFCFHDRLSDVKNLQKNWQAEAKCMRDNAARYCI